MDDVTVAMPWRPEPDRMAPYERCLRFWDDHDYPVVVSDSDPDKVFNHGQAYANAVAAADTELVILIDPDTIPTLSSVEYALEFVQGEVWWCYDEMRIVDQSYMYGDYRNAPVTGEPWRSTRYSTTICCVFRQETYWRLGGQDHRAYRCSDPAFMCAAATLAGARRIPGLAVSFDHRLEGGAARCLNGDPADVIRDLYYAADGNPEAMEALVADPARGCVSRGVEEWKAKYVSPPPGRRIV